MFTVDPAELPDRQRAVYHFVIDYCFRHGFPPALRAVGDHFGIASPNGVACHYAALTRKGLLRRRTIPVAGQVRVVYAPHAKLRVEPAEAGGVRLGTAGGPVAFTGPAWVAWLRGQLAAADGGDG